MCRTVISSWCSSCLRQVNQCDRVNVSTIQVLGSLTLYYIIGSCRLKIRTTSQIAVTFGSDMVFFASAFEHASTDGEHAKIELWHRERGCKQAGTLTTVGMSRFPLSKIIVSA